MLTDVVCALIGLVALRKILSSQPETQEHEVAISVYEAYSAWGCARAREMGIPVYPEQDHGGCRSGAVC